MKRRVFCFLAIALGSVAVQAMTTRPGGTLTSDETWTAAAAPYNVTGNITVPSSRTLTIEPGVAVYLGYNVNLSVSDGGRILAEGTETQSIRITSPPGSGTSWGTLTINGTPGSPETCLAYIYFEGNGKTCLEAAGGTLYLDHASFGTTTHQYVSLDGASFLISNCYFPSGTTAFELLHGNVGIKSGGRGIVRDSFFGSTIGYNDTMDFTGGNRDQNQPIIQYYHNVFTGSSDDILDLDGTDAWIEGNIFLHSHRNGNTPDSSSAVSGGNYGGNTSEITIIGNLFFDCDNAATAKQGNFFTLINNTIVHLTNKGGIDGDTGVVLVRDTTPSPTTFGKGFYLEGNIVVDVKQLVRNYDPAQGTVTWNNNILPMPWTGPGSGNAVLDPMLKHIPDVSETKFTTWQQAQVMWDWFSLLPGSPARGTGPNGTDKGGVIPFGASISGEPRALTSMTTATLTVGLNRTGSGIPSGGFPLGSGFTNYRWRLDSNAWSAETPIATPIKLTGLASGSHHVDVIGKNDAGWYQNDPALGPDAVVTTSRAWTVDPSYQRLILNEILVVNHSAQGHEGTYPGVVELYYDGAAALDLSGMRLTNDATKPTKFVFPAVSKTTPGQYLVLYADTNATTSGLHLGFTLNAGGDNLFLYNKLGVLVDSVTFGPQLTDLSIGRVGPDDAWCLTIPTLGQTNVAQPCGAAGGVKINEWLAVAKTVSAGSFIELYNSSVEPVDLSGMYLTDGPATMPAENRIGPLSFLAGTGYAVFQADDSNKPGHVGFRLSSAGGTIRLFDAQMKQVDNVVYGAQLADISQGRAPDGASTITFLPVPTPGAANVPMPKVVTTNPTLVAQSTDKHALVPTGPISDDWKGGRAFDDTAWLICRGSPGGIGYEKDTGYQTLISLDVGAQMYGSGKNNTCYIRVPFTVDANSLAGITKLTLGVRYDDGFVAYLNGKEVARRNFTGTPAWNSYADSAREANVSDVDERIDLTAFLSSLQAGANILAIHGVNASNTSSDFLITATLDAVLTKAQGQ
jgi:hypothetical protein